MPAPCRTSAADETPHVDAQLVLRQLRVQSRLDNPALPPDLRRNLAAFCDAVGDLLAKASDVHASPDTLPDLVLAAARCGVVASQVPVRTQSDLLAGLIRQIEVEAHRGPSRLSRVRALAIQAADMTRPSSESHPV